MMAVSILLCLGKILLIVLAAVLVLVLLVLFVPVRYRIRAEGSREEGAGTVTAEAAWLCSAVRLRFLLQRTEDGQTGKSLSFYLFGTDLKKRRAGKAERRARARKEKKKKALKAVREKDPARYEAMKAEAAERKRQREAEKRRRQEEESLRRQAEAQALREAEDRRQRMLIRMKRSVGFAERIVRAAVSAIVKLFSLIMDLLGILIGIPTAAAGVGGRIYAKLASVCGTITEWTGFLTDPRASGALGRVKWALKRLILHIRPGRLSGDITFGFEDPSLTGEVLAGASALYCLYGGELSLNPEFGGSALHGNLEGRGRLFVFYAAYIGLRTWFDHDVVYVRKYFKQKKEAADNGGEP